MKTLLTLFTTFLTVTLYSQYEVKLVEGQLEKKEMAGLGSILKIGVNEPFTIIKADANNRIEFSGEPDKSIILRDAEGLTITLNPASGVVSIVHKVSGGEEAFSFCKEVFEVGDAGCAPDAHVEGGAGDETKKQTTVIALYKLPRPLLQTNKNAASSKNARYIVIDEAKPNHGIYKLKDSKMNEVKAIGSKGSMGVLLTNYGTSKIESVDITLSGLDYTYEYDLSDLKGDDKEKEDKDETPRQIEDGDQNPDQTDATSTSQAKTSYLNNVIKQLREIEYLNIRDMKQLKIFKDSLQKVTINMLLTQAQRDTVHAILDWQPSYVALTTTSLNVPDADEVIVAIDIKHVGEDKSKKMELGDYRVFGGLAVSLNSNIYITGLANNDVYTDSLEMEDGTKELRAELDESNEFSVGIGLNAEMSYRTSSIVRPTLSAGLFVPFDEDISPFFAVGPGFSIGSKKVKFSLSGGPAFGKINQITSRYDDVDLSTFDDLTNDSLTTKAWSMSWQFNVGLSFNLSK